MKAALDLVAERGFHGASMLMVAERAGVAAGNIYVYFESKDELIAETYRDLEMRFFRAVNRGYRPGDPVRARFLHLAKNLLDCCLSFPVELKFLEQFHAIPYGFPLRCQIRLGDKKNDLANDLFLEAVEQQLVRNLPPSVLFDLSFGFLFIMARHHHSGSICIDQEQVCQIVERAWSGIAQ